MQLIKQKITQHFDRAATSYDLVATVQQQCAKYLIYNLVENFKPCNISKILDVGSGTGYVANLLIKKYPNSIIDLNDLSSNMLKIASQKLKLNANSRLILGDMEQIDFLKYDLIATNLSLQWVENLEAMLIKLYTRCRYFAFSCLLAGTFQEWLDQFNSLRHQFPMSKYPQFEELKKMLLQFNAEQHLFKIKTYDITFNNSIEFIKYLKKLGAGINVAALPFSEFKKAIQSQKPLNLTYKVFFGFLKSKVEH